MDSQFNSNDLFSQDFKSQKGFNEFLVKFQRDTFTRVYIRHSKANTGEDSLEAAALFRSQKAAKKSEWSNYSSADAT